VGDDGLKHQKEKRSMDHFAGLDVWWKGLGADSEEKQEPASDINNERWIA
jgi:hypothetical protein